MKKSFGIDLIGRVKNFSLPTNKPLMPLFEAVVNSFHAIEAKQSNCGEIKIHAIREQTLIDDRLDPIVSFEVFDNGIGFNDDNFNSFMKSDSTFKSNLGGKGVGRFSWLKAFKNVQISSIYQNGEKFYKREFIFSTTTNEIDDSSVITESQDSHTKIFLNEYQDEYKESVNKKLETIATKLIYHCLMYFLVPQCPQVILYDKYESINVNQLFQDKISTDTNTVNFFIDDKEFSLLHIKVDKDMATGHALNLCANNRFVKAKDLSKYIVNLADCIKDGNEAFWYLGILNSTYLDKYVDTNRLSFQIPENRFDAPLASVISFDDIMQAVTVNIQDYLKSYLTPIQESKSKQIEDYVKHVAPQYRHLLKYIPERVMGIKPNLSETKLDEELYKLKRELDGNNKKEVFDLSTALNQNIISSEEYEDKMSKIVTSVTDSNKSILAEYVAHRKIILDLLEFGLHKDENQKYQKESFIHNLIFPMKSTMDDIQWENHNLWLIDERLSYFLYAASDLPLGGDKTVKDRPDILLYDKIVTLSEEENTSKPKDNIVLIEFKRPMRDDYKYDDPVNQLTQYQTELEQNRFTDKNGRPIRVGASTKFYLYAICDISEDFRKKLIKTYSMTEDVGGGGFYRFSENTMLSVLSLDKIKEDAKKRNKILFDKLGL